MRLDLTFRARRDACPLRQRLPGLPGAGLRLKVTLLGVVLGSGLLPAMLAGDPAVSAADPGAFGTLASEYKRDVQPLLAQFCLDCHSRESVEGDLDLQQFATLAEVRQQPQRWLQVLEMINLGEMPPEDAPQLPVLQRQKLLSWTARYLDTEALAGAGDPGPVVLRRLNNAEYTYTVGDLTQVPLNPARQFPTEGAAGEGFTNTGNALVLSPALIRKYLDAGKQIAAHAVLLPGGFRFSNHVTRRDWTDELLEKIRQFYEQFCHIEPLEPHYGHASTPLGNAGRLPIEKYLAVTLAERDALLAGNGAVAAVAAEHGLQARYLGSLWSQLNGGPSSILLDDLRSRWRTAGPGDAPALAAWVKAWQQGVWIFNPVGLLGKKGNQGRWLEPVNPLLTEQELRLPLPTPEGRQQVYVAAAYQRERPKTAEYLAACASLQRRVAVAEGIGRAIIDDEAISRDLESDVLVAWLKYLGIWHKEERAVLPGGMLEKFEKDFDGVKLQGWGYATLPWIFANQSTVEATAPAVPVGALVVQPSPNQPVAVGWRCPSDMEVEVEVNLSDAYAGSADGVRWSVEVSRHGLRKELVHGICDDGESSGMHLPATPQQRRWLKLRRGDWLALILDVIEDYHGDNYLVELTIGETSGEHREWDLVKDVANDIQSGNPHVDSYGDPRWSFIALRKKSRPGEILPWLLPDSALAQWYAAVADSAQESNLEERTQHLAGMLAGDIPPEINPSDKVVVGDYAAPDRALWSLIEPTRQADEFVVSLRAGDAGDGSLHDTVLCRLRLVAEDQPDLLLRDVPGLPADWFGHHPQGRPIDPAMLCLQAPSVITFRLPAELAGRELVAEAVLDPLTGGSGSVQLELAPDKLGLESGLLISKANVELSDINIGADTRALSYLRPVLVSKDSSAHDKFQSALEEFRQLFPAALCYTKIVPSDESLTLTLFYREDDQLARLILDESQQSQVDKLWEELWYVSREPFRLVDVLESLLETTIDHPQEGIFEALEEPYRQRAAKFSEQLVETESIHLDALVDFAVRAWRRPVTDPEEKQLREVYAHLRGLDLDHAPAFRLTLAHVFIASPFLFRLEEAPPGTQAAPVSDWELANRLSYFLWSSLPDDPLRATALAGRLNGRPGHDEEGTDPLAPGDPDREELLRQTRRMLADPRVRRLATEFGGQWLHVHQFDPLETKSDSHFPEFAGLRADMYEESIRLLTDLFQQDGSLLSLLNADHTFVNSRLAGFYGLPWEAALPGARTPDGAPGSDWRRVDGIRQYGRGGILGLATTLAKQSGATRTSPILRGNWISEVLLGEKLPRPPENVPQLADDIPDGLTERELIERHSRDPACAKCHARIDPFGFALENYDAIGRLRKQNAAGLAIDSRTTLPDGSVVEGFSGLQQYLLEKQREAFLRQFCRKLLGYALGREVQLSDRPLLDEILAALPENDYRFSTAVEAIVVSRQFRQIRGREMGESY